MKTTQKYLTSFFLFAFLWSWLCWMPLVLVSFCAINIPTQFFSWLKMPLIIIGAFGPMIAALIVIKKEHGKGSQINFLREFLDFRLGWKAYLFPLLVLGGSTAFAWILPEFFGEKRLDMFLPSVWLFFPYLIIMILFGGGQEEFGWRAYALPLLENRFGIWKANFLLGIIWAFWHLPLWFIADTSQTFMNFGGFILLTIGYSFVFSWIREISGKKAFSGLFVHGVANAFIPLMPILIMQKNVEQPRFWIWAVVSFVIGIVITLFRSKNKLIAQ